MARQPSLLTLGPHRHQIVIFPAEPALATVQAAGHLQGNAIIKLRQTRPGGGFYYLLDLWAENTIIYSLEREKRARTPGKHPTVI